jgi:hypothetical protein
MPKQITKQRDKMRELYGQCKGDKGKACAVYVDAEKAGEVKRKSNKRAMSAGDYASRLWDDGIRKGWLSK